jgi:hypothetical protein
MDYKINKSEFPSNFIPKDAEILIGVDISNGKETTIKGFYLDGIYHIQEITEKVGGK